MKNVEKWSDALKMSHSENKTLRTDCTCPADDMEISANNEQQ